MLLYLEIKSSFLTSGSCTLISLTFSFCNSFITSNVGDNLVSDTPPLNAKPNSVIVELLGFFGCINVNAYLTQYLGIELLSNRLYFVKLQST